jgi:TP901 family phage tail tape measure protein
MAGTIRIPTEFTAIDKFTSVVSKMSTGVSSFSKSTEASIDRVNKKLGKVSVGFAAAGATVLGLGGVAVNSFNDFEKSMSNVSTLVDTNVEDMAKMGDEVLKLSTKLPVPIDDLTTALYDVRSAGIESSKAIATLETSAKLATAGLSTTQESTNILTSAMNAFKKEGISSEKIADILFKTVKAGKTTISELATGFGATAGIIESSGTKFADFQAATAALTTVGTPATQAQNQLRASIVAMQKPTSEMTKIFKKLGVSSEKELIKKTGGLVNAFTAIEGAGKGLNINMAKAWSSVEAGAAVTSLLGATNGAYTSTLESMTNGADALGEAFEKQAKTGASQAQIAKNNMQALSITIGAVLAPMVSALVQKVAPLISSFRDWASENPRLIKTIGIIGAVLLGFAGALKATQLVLTISQVVMAGYTAIMAAYSGVAVTAALTGSTFAAVIWATLAPILAVIAAIAAIIAIFYYWDEIVAWFGKQFETFTNWISSLWQSVVGWFQSFDFVNFFMSIGQAIINYMLFPLKTVLGLMSKLPGGIGEAASKALASINSLTDLGVNAEILPSPEQKQAENLQNVGIKGGINIDVRDKGGNVAGVSSQNQKGGIPINVTSTQGAY